MSTIHFGIMRDPQGYNMTTRCGKYTPSATTEESKVNCPECQSITLHLSKSFMCDICEEHVSTEQFNLVEMEWESTQTVCDNCIADDENDIVWRYTN
jgi:hypothetical protein